MSNQTILTTENVTVVYEREYCKSCQNAFYYSGARKSYNMNDGGSFWCPYCGTKWTYREGEKERLKAERERLQKQLAVKTTELDQVKAEADRQKRRAAAQFGQNTKLRKQIAGGICPCCRRPFANLMRHMQNQHPDFVNEGTHECNPNP